MQTTCAVKCSREETRTWWFPGAIDFRVARFCISSRKEGTSLRSAIRRENLCKHMVNFNIHYFVAYTQVFINTISNCRYNFLMNHKHRGMRAFRMRIEKTREIEREEGKRGRNRKRCFAGEASYRTHCHFRFNHCACVAKRCVATAARLARQEKSRNVNSLSWGGNTFRRSNLSRASWKMQGHKLCNLVTFSRSRATPARARAWCMQMLLLASNQRRVSILEVRMRQREKKREKERERKSEIRRGLKKKKESSTLHQWNRFYVALQYNYVVSAEGCEPLISTIFTAWVARRLQYRANSNSTFLFSPTSTELWYNDRFENIPIRMKVCVCVCMCVWERERKGAKGK